MRKASLIRLSRLWIACIAALACMLAMGRLRAADGPLIPGLGGSKDSGLPVTSTPEAFTRFKEQQSEREVVSPALGYEAKPKPSPFSRMKSAVSNSKMGKSFSSMFKRSPKPAPESKDPNDAVSLSTKLPPPKANLYVSMARLHEKQGNLEAAASQYRKALEKSPDDLNALVGYARLLDRQGNFGEATRMYQKAVEKHPQDAGAFNDLGLCLARQNQLDRALPALERAVQLQPDRKLYRNNIAMVLVEAGQLDRAYQHLEAAHGPAVAHYNLGFLLTQANQLEAAADHFEQAVAKDPSFTAAQQWREVVRSRLEQARQQQVSDSGSEMRVAERPRTPHAAPPQRDISPDESSASGSPFGRQRQQAGPANGDRRAVLPDRPRVTAPSQGMPQDVDLPATQAPVGQHRPALQGARRPATTQGPRPNEAADRPAPRYSSNPQQAPPPRRSAQPSADPSAASTASRARPAPTPESVGNPAETKGKPSQRKAPASRPDAPLPDAVDYYPPSRY